MGLEVTAAPSIAGPLWGQEPPETAGEGAGAEGAGACDGAWTLLPEFPELSEFPELLELSELAELDPLLDGCDALLAVLELVFVWPWKDFAAATEITPLSAIAPAMSHPLIRRISSKPASLAVMALFRTLHRIAPR